MEKRMASLPMAARLSAGAVACLVVACLLAMPAPVGADEAPGSGVAGASQGTLADLAPAEDSGATDPAGAPADSG